MPIAALTLLTIAIATTPVVQVLDDGLLKVVRQNDAEPVARMTEAIWIATEHCMKSGKLVRMKDAKHYEGEHPRTEVLFRCEK